MSELASLRGIVTIASLILLAVSLAACIVLRDTASFQLLIGAIIANAGAAVNYFLGSSDGSRAKDKIIAASAPPVSTEGTKP